jgi:hypothetical protein
VTTPNITITGVQLGDAGNYSVVVTNNYGSITSSVAALTITGTAPLRFAANPVVANGRFQAQLTGTTGVAIILQTSADLYYWMDVATNTMSASGLSVNWPISTNKQQYIRARLVQ